MAQSWRLGVGMELPVLVRRVTIGLAGALMVLGVMVLAAHADELSGVTEHATGLVIHDATETLERYCVTDSTGTVWLALPDGTRWELITSTQDPAIANPGDGAFHPFDAGEVRAAISGLHYPLHGIAADVFLLPYPRRAGLPSAAAPGLVLLSPGVRPIDIATQHATVTHELGHLVHFTHLPDSDADTWSHWRALRGVTDASFYCASAPHADRPHEIFAEDFRVLFGDALASSDGAIENAALAAPATVPGLDTFVRALAGAPGTVALSAWPNPARGAVTFTRAGNATGPVEVFDLTGRRVASLAPVGAGASWFWDGRGDDGRALPSGRYLARERGVSRTGAMVTLLR
jgi:hypothetical protein